MSHSTTAQKAVKYLEEVTGARYIDTATTSITKLPIGNRGASLTYDALGVFSRLHTNQTVHFDTGKTIDNPASVPTTMNILLFAIKEMRDELHKVKRFRRFADETKFYKIIFPLIQGNYKKRIRKKMNVKNDREFCQWARQNISRLSKGSTPDYSTLKTILLYGLIIAMSLAVTYYQMPYLWQFRLATIDNLHETYLHSPEEADNICRDSFEDPDLESFRDALTETSKEGLASNFDELIQMTFSKMPKSKQPLELYSQYFPTVIATIIYPMLIKPVHLQLRNTDAYQMCVFACVAFCLLSAYFSTYQGKADRNIHKMMTHYHCRMMLAGMGKTGINTIERIGMRATMGMLMSFAFLIVGTTISLKLFQPDPEETPFNETYKPRENTELNGAYVMRIEDVTSSAESQEAVPNMG